MTRLSYWFICDHHVTPRFSALGHPPLELRALMGAWYSLGYFDAIAFFAISDKITIIFNLDQKRSSLPFFKTKAESGTVTL